MPEEPEGGEIIKPRENIIIIPRQDVEFSTPPSPKTKETKTKIQDEMIAFIRQNGFDMAMNSPKHRCLLIDEGLGIGPFKSLEEIYDYVKKGYPAADIERYKSSLAANGFPEDFHKLPFEVIQKWPGLPEEVRQAIRERGVGNVKMRKIEKNEAGERVIQPDPKFQTESEKREGTEEDQKKDDEKHLEYIQDSGFQLHSFEDGEVGIKIDSKHIIGPFPSLETAYRYFKEGHHLTDIGSIKQIDSPTVH